MTLITHEWRRNGGVASYLRRLARALAARGDEVQVVHADRAAPPEDGVRDDCIEGAMSYIRSRGHREAASAAVLDALRGFAPDVVHVHSCNNFALEAAIRARYRATKSLHVYDFCPSNTKFHHTLNRACTVPTSALCLPRMGYLTCTTSRRPGVWLHLQRRARDANRNNAGYARIIVASEYVRAKALETGYPADQVEVVPYFVESEEASQPEPRLIVTGGRLVREKGIDLFIDALLQVPQPWRAIVAGDGLEAAALARHADARGLGGAVEFAGWQDETAMRALYRRAALVVVPSRWPEPSGIIGLEAMAHGKPVAAFATGGIPEWLEHGVTGMLAPPLDTSALAASMTAILGDETLARRMGETARARAAERFGAATHVARLTAIYDALPGPA